MVRGIRRLRRRAIYLCNEVDLSSRTAVFAGGCDPPLRMNWLRHELMPAAS